MEKISIKMYPAGVLRTKCCDIKGVGKEEVMLFSDMLDVMHEVSGIGLAAPQVGISKNIAIMEVDGELLRMANPKIISRKGVSFFEEGCLSVPENVVNIKRAEEIVISYVDGNDKLQKRSFSGLQARVIQHEIDHLNGKLIIDYLPWYKKLFMGRG